MRLAEALLCLLCVSLVSIGQVLMRRAALIARQSDLGIGAWVNGTTLFAVAIYATAMLLWLWVLGRVPLTQAFAFFGLSFIVVPLLAHRLLDDPVSVQTWVGGAVIIGGIAITNWPRA
jgi:undecaprenyl phosphate-alpha-L-ara4N flippase subunit ArnE